jgi:hypothetical protein
MTHLSNVPPDGTLYTILKELEIWTKLDKRHQICLVTHGMNIVQLSDVRRINGYLTWHVWWHTSMSSGL